ncbi:MAG: COX aromatic rich motif-containing protein, partial [Geminicoccaceae bacterium]
AATLGFAWWYRAGNARARYRPDWAYSGEIEVVVWSIPLMTIMLLGGVAWIGSHDLDPASRLPSKDPPLKVQVVSLDWKWLFIYPERRVATVNELVLPAGVPVHFTLTSASVMNAFFIPSLGSMIYAMNGMAAELNLQADQPGDMLGLSSHFSGDGFADMDFTVRVVATADFDSWLERTGAGGPTLDLPAYRELSRQSIAAAPLTYRAVDPELFHRIVTQELPPAPGPTVETNPGAARRAGN